MCSNTHALPLTHPHACTHALAHQQHPPTHPPQYPPHPHTDGCGQGSLEDGLGGGQGRGRGVGLGGRELHYTQGHCVLHTCTATTPAHKVRARSAAGSSGAQHAEGYVCNKAAHKHVSAHSWAGARRARGSGGARTRGHHIYPYNLLLKGGFNRPHGTKHMVHNRCTARRARVGRCGPPHRVCGSALCYRGGVGVKRRRGLPRLKCEGAPRAGL